MANGGNQFVNFLFGNFLIVINDLEVFRFRVPAGKFDSCVIEGSFNTLLAHRAVAKDLEIGFR
jgi:hypothetical protein